MKKNILILIMFAFFFSSQISGQDKIPFVIGTWDKNTEADLAGYKVYWGESPRNYNWNIDVGLVNFIVLADTLSYSKYYYFAVTAYDSADNESNYSDEVIFFSKKAVIDTVAPLNPKNSKFIELKER